MYHVKEIVPVGKDCVEKITITDLYISIYMNDKIQQEIYQLCFKRQNPEHENIKLPLRTHNKKTQAFLLLFKRIMEFKFEYEKADKFLLELRNYKSVLSRLLEAYIYYLSGNNLRSERIITQIMQRDVLFHHFHTEQRIIDNEKHIEMLYKIIDFFEKESFNSSLLENLIIYFSHSSSGEFARRIQRKYKLNYSISSIRKKYHSVIFGAPFAYVWAAPILKLASASEYRRFFSHDKLSVTLKQRSEDILLFKGLVSIPKEMRSSVLEHMNKLAKSKSYFDYFLYLTLLDQELFFNLVSNHGNIKLGLISNKKRKFYLKSLSSYGHREFSIFKLFYLGDSRAIHFNKLFSNREN